MPMRLGSTVFIASADLSRFATDQSGRVRWSLDL